MTEQRDESMAARAKEVIAAFLATNPEPSTEQWKRLIEQHNEFAGEIADAALLRAHVNHLVDEDVEAPLNVDAFNASVSNAINLVHKTPSPIASHIEQRVAEVRGPAVRKLAAELGLGAVPALLNSVLAGTVTAPKKLLEPLADKFETNVAALLGFLVSSFHRQAVPAFKAKQGKPEVAVEQTAWADAVRASQLSPEQTKALLELDA